MKDDASTLMAGSECRVRRFTAGTFCAVPEDSASRTSLESRTGFGFETSREVWLWHIFRVLGQSQGRNPSRIQLKRIFRSLLGGLTTATSRAGDGNYEILGHSSMGSPVLMLTFRNSQSDRAQDCSAAAHPGNSCGQGLLGFPSNKGKYGHSLCRSAQDIPAPAPFLRKPMAGSSAVSWEWGKCWRSLEF